MADVQPGPSPKVRGDPLRDPAALSNAINARWRVYRFRAYIFGLVAGLVLGTIPAAVATSTILAILAVEGVVPDPSLPWSEVLWTLAFVVVFAASGGWAVARWLPARFKAALESYVWLATRAEAQWWAVFHAPVPRKAQAMRAFLGAATVTPETAGDIAPIWLALGDLDTARNVVATMPESTGVERHRKAVTSWLVDFVGGMNPPLEPIEASVGRIEDADDRLEAQVGIAVDASRVALARDADWIGPMAAVREWLGPEPSTVLWGYAFPPTFRTMLVFGGIGAISFWFFDLIR